MSSNAKLFCNFKLDYIEKNVKSYKVDCMLISIRDFSKKKFIDLINKGILCKFPDIIESIADYYYCLDVNKYTEVNGQHLFNLWEKNSLIIDVYNDNYSSEEEKVSQIEWSIKYITKDAIINYIKNVLHLFNIYKSRTITQKNWILKDNTIFLKIDKLYYLIKCLEDLNRSKK